MPTPPLPSRDDDEHGAMPADCSVETLHFWLERMDNGACSYHDLARAVRALLEERVRLAVRFCSYDDETDAHVADVVRHVLGSPS